MRHLSLAEKLIAENKRTRETFLDLGNCGLKIIPDELRDLSWLESISFSSRWSTWDGEYWKNKRSQNDGEENTVTDLSPLTYLIALKECFCSKTQVSDLTPLAGLTALHVLDCSSTPVSDLTPLFGLTALQALNCSSTRVSDLMPLAGLKALQMLYCDSTEVSDLTPLAGLTALHMLDCSSTQVSDLTPLAGLTALQLLYCSRTQVSDLTPLAGLPALQMLDCSSTEVSDLTPLAGLTVLRSLDCGTTQVSDLTPLAGLTGLRSLDCYNTRVSALTPLVGLTVMQSLSCAYTHVSDLTPLAGLTALRTLSCSSMPVSALTPLAGLVLLQSLDCSDTQVSALTPLAGLKVLEKLYCYNTRVSDLTPLAGLTALQLLSCFNTQVSDLTPLAGLKALEKLWCRKTQVSDLTPLASLKALQRLDCDNTQVSDLRPLLDHIRRGVPVNGSDGILVRDCPLTEPPANVVAQGNAAILNYFAERDKGPTDHLYEAKMLVLGEGGSGKSSLIRRLYHPELTELPKEDETTKGIVIERHDFPMKNGRTFRLNVWDFGGQQIYHATHQFFLTQRSLYVLLDDTRSSDKSVSDKTFRYWLELIDVFSEHSPALIFQNEKSGRSKSIDFDGIQRQYPNAKELYKGNLDDQNSTDQIRNAIEHFAEMLPHIGEELPASWVTIRAEIEELSKTKYVIPVEEYLTLCAPRLDGDAERAFFLSSYLHDLGVFLHFQDDPILRRTVILQNEWATTAVFRILDDEEVKKRLGRFSEADCSRLWQDTKYGRNHYELLALMEKFELCYRLRDTQPATWLAPQLLPPSKPDGLKDWGKPGDLILRYKYEFLPGGMISRLTVRLHRYVVNPEKAWVTGVLFEEPCFDRRFNELLVEILPSGDEIELRARGPEMKKLLSVVSADLEALNDSFKGLRGKVKKFVPCLCDACKTKATPRFFEYEELLRYREHGERQIKCAERFLMVDVLELLDGIKLSESTEDGKAARAARPLRTIKVFLASSSELLEDRDDFELAFRRLNDELVKDGFHLEIVRWENFLDAISDTRKQDDYNENIRVCDVFVSLFFTKAGKFSNEELDVAHQQFLGTGRPLTYTYIKDAPINTGSWKKDDQDSMHALKEKLKAIGHYPTSYTGIDNLINQFRNQLPKIREKLWP